MSNHFGGDALQVLGEQLLDFLHLFGEDFDMTREGFSVRGGGFRFICHDNPPHPQAGDPIVIEVRFLVCHDFSLLDTMRVSWELIDEYEMLYLETRHERGILFVFGSAKLLFSRTT